MQITVICPHFAPDVAPTGEVMTAIASELIKRDHVLHVVTSLPWYRHHRLEPGWEGQLWRHEDTDWGRITRVHPFPTDKAALVRRALAFGGFTALATAIATVGPRPDVVLSMSPPLSLGLSGWIVARRWNVPFVFNIQDVFPDVAVELGLLTNSRAISAAQWLERFSYRRSDSVTVLSEDLADNVRNKIAHRLSGSDRDEQVRKVRVIPNFVDTERIRPTDKENSYTSDYDLVGKRVVMYAGNVGLSQSLDLVLDAAEELSGNPDVVFVINGGGVARGALERRAEGMNNVRFVEMQPRERLAEVLAAADIHVVPLKAGLARSSVPSKLYSILAAGRPVVASVDPGTEVATTIERAGAGVSVGPEDSHAFTAAIRGLLEAPEKALEMGVSGRRFVESWVSPAAVARSYEDLFEQLCAGVVEVAG